MPMSNPASSDVMVLRGHDYDRKRHFRRWPRYSNSL